jgi:hypothetical protein
MAAEPAAWFDEDLEGMYIIVPYRGKDIMKLHNEITGLAH